MNNHITKARYEVGTKVCWRNETSGTLEEGTVLNENQAGVDVIHEGEEYWIPFQHILHTA